MDLQASPPTPDIVAFDDPLPAGADATMLLGGKGAGLAEMTRVLRLPVPPGFTITTEVGRRYLAEGWPDDLDAALTSHLDRLGQRLGRRLGDPETPLLVSVRSGAPVSMPGMLDTVLNVGMTEAIRAALAASGKPRFAAETWLRFCRMYARVVLGIPERALAEAATADGTPEGLLAAERVRALAARAGGIPTDPQEQIRGAVLAVFQSWNSERARAFRAREQVPDTLGTAVTIQAMVFGNLDDRSGTGVVFTRNPATGEPGPYGDYLPGAQGEDVVAGTHTVRGLDALLRQAPAAYHELLAVLDRLERHYRDLCDVEFTLSDGTLSILQTRIGRRSPLAAVRIAVAMAADPDFPLSQAEAVARVDATLLRQLARHSTVRGAATPLATGIAASPGVGAGVLCCDPDRAAELTGRGVAVVLAREETSPSDIHGIAGAAGLMTTRGGVASHAAVVTRGWAIPAVTSLADALVLAEGVQIGDRFLAEGTIVTVDGTAGALYAGDQREQHAAEIPELATLRAWAADLGVELDQSQTPDSATTPAVDPNAPGRPRTVARSTPSSPAQQGRSIGLPVSPAQLGNEGRGGVSPAPSLYRSPDGAPERTAVPPADRGREVDPSVFELARTVQLKGLCTAERAAAALATEPERIEALFAANGALFRSTPRGFALTPVGRTWASDQLAAERAAIDGAALDAYYAPFSALNQRFKQLVSGWQLAAPDGQTDAAWESLVATLTTIHAELQPLIAQTAAEVTRLAAFARRFDEALGAMREGDRSMLASPLKESYHTIWFEYHEELIALSGRDRASEED
jgi:pyruvate,orthophosphate dikinase